MTEAAGQSQAFQADVARLLHLMVHSIYSDRDIFLRELLSNAADACEKLRYEALANAEFAAAPFKIVIALDKEAGVLSVEDNGVGMTREELADSLGTIARSGTRAFLDRLGARPEATEGGDDAETAEAEAGAEKNPHVDLIGQFGIGFYSAFMVADRVDVYSRRAGSNEAFVWSSDGKGAFTIAPLALDQAPEHGTRVALHINESSKEYLDPYKIEQIVREHSSALAAPIDLVESPGAEPRRLSDGQALWTKPKSAIKPEEYADFYHTISGQFDEPALTVHWRAEGRHEYTVLAFVPSSRPFDLFNPERHGRGKLYVRHVLISDDAEILPRWLRFVRIVVDSADLPLNVSREMIQESPVFGAIKKAVANRLLQELVKLSESDPAKFAEVWKHFGVVLKEGLYESPEKRDALFDLARFASSTHPEGGRTLKEYVAGLKENQTAIYYLLGDDLKRLAASPQLEGFAARGVEVLLLPDPIDAFWVGTAAGYDGKPFKSVTQGAADIASIPRVDPKPDADKDAPQPANLAALFALMKQTLEGAVEEVRASDRLAQSPACLIAPERGPDRRLEQLLAEHGQLGAATKPILEINPKHPLIEALAGLIGSPDKQKIEDITWLIFDEARLMEGEKPQNASDFATRLTRILIEAAARPAA
ncbi:heat shock protein Hsp90 [Methylocella silvestris BL2]|uniref:Chaperone protein HtpG n=1 Tax=Methylocella silvestris (strain DSM 15510 / CIP 108128 / LMG 27833 / NCIMB 13906 / BL2) TaxID=395965 RepID=B8ENR9_METSB|nr:molecular chaperone HtpG [Methylocella silvestris]ACK50855.1 heat shock protein Hsp90 [Methylocella silvestris BL2]